MATKEKSEQELTGVEDTVSDDEEGVLLYYKFVQIPEPDKIKSWLFDLSASLNLLGRIRVAPDGINVTVGGKMLSLHEHIEVVGSNPLFEGIDFKLASNVRPIHHRAAAECGFTSLSARMVQELVTLGLHPSVEPPSVSKAGKHVTAQEFHEMLQDVVMPSHAESWNNSASSVGAGMSQGGGTNPKVSLGSVHVSAPRGDGTGGGDDAAMAQPSGEPGRTASLKKIVVVDARNLYETRIGKFCPPKGIEVMEPMIRQYSDLPRWIDEHQERLRNNQILMYCTGGVRCEMASAYIRSKGKDFEDVFQLSGGIQRYLEAFPDGGYFAGKNFVFDYRLAVPSSNQDVVGSCLICNARFDDYSTRCRCSLCRMLILVCTDCQVAGAQESDGPEYICELCGKEKKDLSSRRQVELRGPQQSERSILSYDSSVAPPPVSKGADEVHTRKLKILCLHGFRQSASSLKGRLNALRKKLRQKVELVFVDAPHEIPSINLRCQQETCVLDEAMKDARSNDKDPSPRASTADDTFGTASGKVSKKFAWLINAVTVANAAATENPESSTLIDTSIPVTGCDDPEAQRSPAATVRLESMIDKPDFVTRCDHSEMQRSTIPTTPSSHQCRQENSVVIPDDGLENATRTELGNTTANCSQYQMQTEGWATSWEHLKTVFAELGPFDGVLGFSQGAAVAAALCNLRRSFINQQSEAVNFRFVILCSGFCSPAMEYEQRLSLSGSTTAIDCPSLHVFGGSPGLDRQIGVCESEELASLFRSDNRMIVRHNFGHIVPTRPEYVQQYLKFLDQFQ